MRAGLLRDIVVFQVKTLTTNAHGQQVVSWGGDFEAWAQVQRQSEQACRFIVRYFRTTTNAEVSASTHRLLWDGCIWSITNSVHDERRTMLTIDSDASALIETTHMQSVTTEYIDGLPVVRPPE